MKYGYVENFTNYSCGHVQCSNRSGHRGGKHGGQHRERKQKVWGVVNMDEKDKETLLTILTLIIALAGMTVEI